jgi:hypothetical protein
VGIAGASAIALAGAITVPATTTGCTTHQCDPSPATFSGGRWIDYTTYETSDWNEDWVPFPGQVTLNVVFPPGGASPGRGLVSIESYVGTGISPSGGPDFQGGENFATSAGQLNETFFASSTGFFVFNGSCADYFARFVAHFAPPGFTIFGGSGPTSGGGLLLLDDTWTWDGSQWSSQGPSASTGPAIGPSAREGAAMATVNGLTYMFGGLHEVGIGDAGRTVLVPVEVDRQPGDGGTVPTMDTWSWNGAAWQQTDVAYQLPGDGAVPLPPWPSPRTDAAVAVLKGTVVLFGGHGFDVTTHDEVRDLGDTWIWDGNPEHSWISLTFPAGAAPSPRSGAAAASAAAAGLDGTMILVGGSSNGTLLADTWAFNGTSWTQLTPSVSPSPRFHAAIATVPDSVLLFGGDSGSGALGDTWLWNGTNWTRPNVAIPPAPRYQASAGSLNGTGVLFGGTDGSIQFLDTWTWSAGTWAMQNPTLPPPPRFGAAAAGN